MYGGELGASILCGYLLARLRESGGFALVRGGKSRFGATFDRAKLDNLTLGLESFAAANLHRLPVAVARLATLRRRMLSRVRDYDVLFTPTLAVAGPRVLVTEA